MRYVPEPDQLLMTAHLLKRKRAALLVGMGRGKTAATLQAICARIYDTAGGALVIAPKNVVLLTWPAEIELWDEFRWLRIANLRTRDGIAAWYAGTADIYLINWEAIPAFVKKVMLYVKAGQQLPANILVYDELSKAKSHSSKRVNLWRRFTYLFDYHYGLTGTPNPNSYLDLFAQFRLLCGQKSPLGTSFVKFRQEYFNPVDWNQYKWELREGSKEKIEKLIKPYVLSLGGDKFPKEYEDIEVPLTEEATKFYKKLEKDLLARIRDKDVDAANAAVLIQKLLQVTSGCVYNAEKEMVPIHNEKIKALKKLRKQHPKEPLLVVTMFTHERKRLIQAFPDAELFKATQEDMGRWNAGKIPMLIVDPRSTGHGLNMQYYGWIIIWFSQTYSREYYDQTNSRLARKGQKKTVKVYHLLCPETADWAVMAALEHKGTQQAGLLSALRNIQILHKSA